MNRNVAALGLVPGLFCLGAAGADVQQYPVLGRVAQKAVATPIANKLFECGMAR